MEEKLDVTGALALVLRESKEGGKASVPLERVSRLLAAFGGEENAEKDRELVEAMRSELGAKARGGRVAVADLARLLGDD